MKFEHKNAGGFTPKEITITIETSAEAKAIYNALGNTAPSTRADDLVRLSKFACTYEEAMDVQRVLTHLHRLASEALSQ